MTFSKQEPQRKVTKEVIRSRNSNDRQYIYIDQRRKNKRTTNDPQTLHRKLKIGQHQQSA